MVVSIGDIEYRLSAPEASAGDSDAGTRDTSLGGYLSTTEIVDASESNLFRPTTGDENDTGIVLYRCIFIVNTNGTDSFEDVQVWIGSQREGGADFSIGADPTGVSDVDDTSAQAVTIATETSTPAGVTFSVPTDREDAIALGDLGPGQCVALWVRESVASGAPPVTPVGEERFDQMVLNLRGQTL